MTECVDSAWKAGLKSDRFGSKSVWMVFSVSCAELTCGYEDLAFQAITRSNL